MKTKFSAGVICLLVALLCLFGMTACEYGLKCRHRFGEWNVVKAASCTEDGSQERTCSLCGEKETQSIEMLGHDFADATCVAPKTCKVCSATEGELGTHDFADANCVAPKTCKVCSATEGEPSGKHTPEFFEIDLADYNVCGGKEIDKIRGLKCSGCGTVIGEPITPSADFCVLGSTESEITTDENGRVYLNEKVECTVCGLGAEGTIWSDGTLLCGGEATYQHSCVKVGDEIILDFSCAEALDGDHDYEITYKKIGELCEDGVCAFAICTKCGSAVSTVEEGHFTVSDEKLLRKEIEEGCNAAILEYHCEACNEIYKTELESDCQFFGFFGKRFCTKCNSIERVTEEYGERGENCECLVTAKKEYLQNNKVYFTETSTYTENAHEMTEQTAELLGTSCEDGVKLDTVCKNCGYVDERLSSYVYDHETSRSYEKVGKSCEDGIREKIICTRCGYKDSILHASHIGAICSEVYINGGCNSHYYKIKCYVCNDVIELNVLHSACDFQFVTEHENGDWLYKCTVCGAEKLEKLEFKEDAESCTATLTGTVTYSQNGAVYYVEKHQDIFESHNIKEKVVEMLGTTCEDGVKVIYVCTNCGYEEERSGNVVYYHDPVTSYEKCGEDCEDGIWEIYTCNRCSYEVRGLINSHKGEVCEQIPVAGGCDSYYCRINCELCGKVVDEKKLHTSCDFDFIKGENGVALYQCTVCGSNKRAKLEYGERDEDCRCVAKETVIYSQNDTVYFTETNVFINYNHERVNRVVELHGESCKDGVTLISVCKLCGFEYQGSERVTYAHDIIKSYEKKGESCEDGVWEIITCTRCGYNESTFYASHPFNVFEHIDVEGGCDAYYLKETCGCCGETFNGDLHSLCNFELIDDGFECDVYQCTVCDSIKKITKEYASEGETCKVTVTDEYIKGDKVYFTETNTNNIPHEIIGEFVEMLGPSCDDGVKVNYICTNCGYEEKSWGDVAYYHDTIISYEKVGDVCEEGIWEIFTCTRCEYERRDFHKSHYGEIFEEVPVNGGCGSSFFKFICVGCGEKIDENRLYSWCQFEFVAEDDNGYVLYQCTACGAEKCQTPDRRVETEDGHVTGEYEIIYSQNGEVYYVEKYYYSGYPVIKL